MSVTEVMTMALLVSGSLTFYYVLLAAVGILRGRSDRD